MTTPDSLVGWAISCALLVLGCSSEGGGSGGAGTGGSGTGGDAGTGGSAGAPTCAFEDAATTLCWQEPPAPDTYTIGEAEAYCDGLIERGRDDWRLPRVDELLTLVRGCSSTGCPVTDPGCVDSTCDDTCNWQGCAEGAGPGPSGCYWDAALSGPCDWYMTSSVVGDAQYDAWFVYFQSGSLQWGAMNVPKQARCVSDL